MKLLTIAAIEKAFPGRIRILAVWPNLDRVLGILLISFLMSCGDDAREKADQEIGHESAQPESGNVKDSLEPALIAASGGQLEGLDDPAADGWDSELVSAKIKKQLDGFA